MTTRTSAACRSTATTLAILWAGVAAAATPSEPAAGDAWTVAGRQGLIRFVIVPTALARDREAYIGQIQRLCEPGLSCFINFYTNSTGAPVAVPLPDAIDHEATAVFRRSSKRGSEGLRWSCRLQTDAPDCF
ncbi:MAG: hypothetical protein OEW22_15195 [Rubrivivax sp.]|nr:hypothetical protein [Rubrivivax sp.]